MLSDYTKWKELQAWAEDKVRLESEENSVFFVLLLSKMRQLNSASGWSDSAPTHRPFSMQRGSLQDMYPDMPFDGEDF